MDTTILGVDPSLTATGIAHTDGILTTITYPTYCKGDQRLLEIHTTLEHILTWQKPTRVIIEDPYEAGTASARTGMVHGVIRLTLLEWGILYLGIPPSTLKKFATGRGNATKDDMRMEWYKRTGMDVRDNNQVDAAWLRELGLHLASQPTFTLPKTHTDAITKLRTQPP